MELIPHILKVLSFATACILMIKNSLFDGTMHASTSHTQRRRVQRMPAPALKVISCLRIKKMGAKCACPRTEVKTDLRKEKDKVLLNLT